MQRKICLVWPFLYFVRYTCSFKLFFHVVPPIFDPAHYWGPYLGLQGTAAAGAPRQTSISDYERLHTICSCTQMLVPSSFDQNALGC